MTGTCPPHRRALQVLAAVMTAAVALLALGWEALGGQEQLAARRYASQVAAVSLPASYEPAGSRHGGSYFAAGNGPYASRALRTSADVPNAVQQVTTALQRAGYSVEPAEADPLDRTAPVSLLAYHHGAELEVFVSDALIYDLPYGYLSPVAGRTGVLLVVTDQGRSRSSRAGDRGACHSAGCPPATRPSTP